MTRETEVGVAIIAIRSAIRVLDDLGTEPALCKLLQGALAVIDAREREYERAMQVLRWVKRTMKDMPQEPVELEH